MKQWLSGLGLLLGVGAAHAGLPPVVEAACQPLPAALQPAWPQTQLYRCSGLDAAGLERVSRWRGQVAGEYLWLSVADPLARIELVSLADGKVLHAIVAPDAQEVLIDTYFTEGLPNEALRLTGADGQVYEFLISEFDLSGEP